MGDKTKRLSVEVSDRFDGRPVHVNGLGMKETVLPQGGRTVPDVIDRNIEAIHVAHGLAVLNHPNGVLALALAAKEIASSKSIQMFLEDYVANPGSVVISLPQKDDYGYRTFFIGRNGKVIKRDESRKPTYELSRRDLYVRARIERSDGALARTQPVFPAEVP